MGEEKESRRGKRLTADQVDQIYLLRAKGCSASEISRQTGITRLTVSKYLKNEYPDLPCTPVDRKIVALREKMLQEYDFNIARSFTKTLAAVDTFEDKLIAKMISGAIPAEVTPLHFKQLAEAKRSVVTLPQDLNKERKGIYEQIQSRQEMAVEAEYEELGEAGDLLESAK